MGNPLVIQAIQPYANNIVWVNLLGNAPLSRAGGTSASASSGAGGWQVTDRSRQKASTEWEDYYPFVMTCTCLLDGGATLAVVGGQVVSGAASVEPQCLILESFEAPVPGSQPPLPPRLQLQGPVPHTDLQWVCSKLEFGGEEEDQIRDNLTGLRTQQKFTIEFTEYCPSTVIQSALSPAQQSQLNLGTAIGQTVLAGGGGTYTVVAGDTFQSIAVGIMGNVTYWSQIAQLNNLSTGTVLQAGQVLSLPGS